MMRDKDEPNFRHGGSTIRYDGSGAIYYIGPCPPAEACFTAVWTVEALDKSGKIVGRTTAEGRFSVR